MSTQVAKVLRDAADELELNGWCQGELHVGKSSCMVGAIRRAVGVNYSFAFATDEQATLAEYALNRICDHLGQLPTTFNDTVGRTQAEVVKVLLTAADLAEVES
jgi:hypothetical protein